MLTVLTVLAVIAVIAILFVRYAPFDPDDWHLDPAEIEDIKRNGIRLIGREAPRFPGDAETVLKTFGEVAFSYPRVNVLDGGVDEGMLTLIVRSRTLGFPDVVTAKVAAEGPNLTKISLASRARFGVSDLGVNAARLDQWLQDMRHRLGESGG